MGPFTTRLAKLIGRQDFDGAIDRLRAGLRGDASDADSHILIAQCHFWGGRLDESIAACAEALRCDPELFDAHALLAQLHARKDNHREAAIHARRGIECFPEPLPEFPPVLTSMFKFMGRIFPLFRGPSPDAALQRVAAERTEWFDWAKSYLSWYDETSGEQVKPTEH